MDNPKITYQVLNKIDDVFYEQNETYAGTYNGKDPLSVTIRIWNNFGGTEDVEDLTNFNLTLRFLTVEDSVLLQYVKFTTIDDIEIPSILESETLIGNFSSSVLSGQANTGSEEYSTNYIDFKVVLNVPENTYIKDYDLKSMVLDIVTI